jgi:hypothetical protein
MSERDEEYHLLGYDTVEFQRTTRCHIPEDDTLHNHRCENLKSYSVLDRYMFLGGALLICAVSSAVLFRMAKTKYFDISTIRFTHKE